MAFSSDPTDPAHMTAEQRVAEVAAILAEGVARLHRRAAAPAAVNPPEDCPDSGETRLEHCATTRPDGHGG